MVSFDRLWLHEAFEPLAARALRGDTNLHHYPHLDEVVLPRLANSNPKQEDKKIVEEDIKLYPNPNQGSFVVEVFAKQKQSISIDIVDVTGRFIMNKSYMLSQERNLIQIDLQNVTQGIYFVRLYTDQGLSLGTKRISYIK